MQVGAKLGRRTTLFDGLLYWWDLDDGTQDLLCQHGSGKTLFRNIATDLTSATGSPRLGPCVSLGGSNDLNHYKMDNGADVARAYTSWTANIWFLASVVPTNAGYIVNHRDSAPDLHMQLAQTGSNTSAASGNTTAWTSAVGPAPVLNQWYMITGVFNETADLVSLFLDGVLIDTQSTAGATLATNAAPYYLGQLASAPADNNNKHKGRLWAHGFWNRPLRQFEITELYNGGQGRLYAEL